MIIKEAEANVGGLSNPSKMPEYGTSLPAEECNIGSKLSKILDSICSECYAKKNRYVFKNVQDAMYRRLKALDNPVWIDSMAFLMNNKKKNKVKGLKYFRWHDSGDLQSIRHLHMIVDVANKSPDTKGTKRTASTCCSLKILS